MGSERHARADEGTKGEAPPPPDERLHSKQTPTPVPPIKKKKERKRERRREKKRRGSGPQASNYVQSSLKIIDIKEHGTRRSCESWSAASENHSDEDEDHGRRTDSGRSFALQAECGGCPMFSSFISCREAWGGWSLAIGEDFLSKSIALLLSTLLTSSPRQDPAPETLPTPSSTPPARSSSTRSAGLAPPLPC